MSRYSGRYSDEVLILEFRAEALAQARKELDQVEKEYLRQFHRACWYRWIDVLLTRLGDGWDVISDTSNPEICGKTELLPSDCYEGKVEFAQCGLPVRVWTHQQGVVYVGGDGIRQRVWGISGPNPHLAFEEMQAYICKLNEVSV